MACADDDYICISHRVSVHILEAGFGMVTMLNKLVLTKQS